QVGGGGDAQPLGGHQRLHGLGASVEGARIDRGESNRSEPLGELRGLGPSALVEVDARGLPVQDAAGLGGQGVPDQEEGRHQHAPAYGASAREAPVRAASLTGSRTTKVDPADSSLCTVTSPPWFSAT